MFTKRVNANDIYKVIGKSVTDDLKSGRYTLNDYVDGQGAVDSHDDQSHYGILSIHFLCRLLRLGFSHCFCPFGGHLIGCKLS